MTYKKTLIILAGVFLPLTSGLCMDVTCGSCSNACCQWAFAAELAVMNGKPSIEAHSREVFERYGFDPVPCKDLLDDEEQYYRCAWKSFHKCVSQNCCQFDTRKKMSLAEFLKPAPASQPRFYESLNRTLGRIEFNEEWTEFTERGVSGAEQAEFYSGQVIILQFIDGRWEELHDQHDLMVGIFGDN